MSKVIVESIFLAPKRAVGLEAEGRSQCKARENLGKPFHDEFDFA